MKKLENDDYQGHSIKVGDYQNQVSSDSNEEYYNGIDETLKNRTKLKNQKEKGINVKSRPDPTAKSQSDGSKSLSDDYKPFKAPYVPLVDFEEKRTFPCNTLFDFFNLPDPSSDSSEKDAEGTFLFRIQGLQPQSG